MFYFTYIDILYSNKLYSVAFVTREIHHPKDCMHLHSSHFDRLGTLTEIKAISDHDQAANSIPSGV